VTHEIWSPGVVHSRETPVPLRAVLDAQALDLDFALPVPRLRAVA
jgi:hypothetical protein